ncbi:MAG: hypothetical protein ABL964_05365 [Steroidobacteraceae bacterium]
MAMSGDPSSTSSLRQFRRFEAWLAVGLIGFGLIVLPALIYVTGALLLGAYGGGEHLGSFYGDYFRDLGKTPQTWALALGPYVLVQLVRLIFTDFGNSSPPPAEDKREPAPASRTRERREPTIKL